MRISFGTRLDTAKGINPANGYGYATNCMLASLSRLGYHVEANDSSADVEIWFDQPQNWNFSKGTYRIGYHPWESTQLKEGWAEIMNECDEIWTPSPLIADWYREHAGVTAPIYVYEHGVEHDWTPVERKPKDTIKFLHVGGEATRKGLWDTTIPAFRKAFGKRTDVQLTCKTINSKWNGINYLGRVRYLDEKLEFPQLQDLFYEHDVYVYPSWGEGFGLTPLQAIATGMPTITLPGWAPYKRFLDPSLNVGHELVPSPWPKIHPGKVMKPNVDDVVDRMRHAADNFEEVSDFAMLKAPIVHEAYDWDRITAKVFGDLNRRLN